MELDNKVADMTNEKQLLIKNVSFLQKTNEDGKSVMSDLRKTMED